MSNPSIQAVARAAGKAANKRWYNLTTSQEPCEDHEFIADAVCAATLRWALEQMLVPERSYLVAEALIQLDADATQEKT